MMNKRICIRKLGDTFTTEVVPIPTPPAKGCIVKVTHAGLCHSDLMLKEEFASTVSYPWVPGHEISGEIHSVGGSTAQLPGGKCFTVGDRVIVYPWVGCGKCVYCKLDKDTRCLGEQTGYGSIRQGGFQQYVSVHDTKYLVKVPPHLPMDVAALLPCSGLTAYNAVTQTLEHAKYMVSTFGECQVLVVGVGGIGQWVVQFAKLLLPDKCKIAVADISEDKLELAKSVGADKTVLWRAADDSRTMVKKYLSIVKNQPQICWDIVNKTQTIKAVTTMMQNSGLYMLVGLLSPKIELNSRLVVFKGLTIKGNATGSLSQLHELCDLVEHNQLRPTHIEYVKLDETPDAFERLHEGRVRGRVVVLPTPHSNI